MCPSPSFPANRGLWTGGELEGSFNIGPIAKYVNELNLLSSLDTGYIRENHLHVIYN